MEFKISQQVKNAKPTAIRKIFMYACDHPEFLDLSIGEPANETFPFEEVKKATEAMFEEDGPMCLAYGPYPGTDDCIEEIRKWLVKRGFDMTDQEIEILPGSGHGMDNMANAFCDEGDVILAEEFCYPGIHNAARMVGAKIIGVQMDDDGINIEDLEKKASTIDRVKFLYLCPTFSNPTGITISEEKRRQIYEIAQKYDFMIYEDDPYSMLSFDGTRMTEIKKLDTDGRVVYAASLAKIVSSGMRVGFFLCHKGVRPYLEMSQGCPGLQSIPVNQIVAKYMRDNDIDEHCDFVGQFYKKKADFLVDCIKKYLPASCEPIEPKGGLFLWLKVPETLDFEQTWDDLIHLNVGVVPSFGFAVDPQANPGNAFRLCYSAPDFETIEEAMKIMGEYLHSKLD